MKQESQVGHKHSFYLPAGLYERVRERCYSVPRSDPRYASINAFVARALEAELKRNLPSRAQKGQTK